MTLFRERLLAARLVERHATSRELAQKLLAWSHPAFSVHLAEAIPAAGPPWVRSWVASAVAHRDPRETNRLCVS